MTQLALTLDHPITGRAAAHLITPASRRRILANYCIARSSVTFYIMESGGELMKWSGNGQKPMWVKQWLANGGSLDDLAVTIKKEGGT
ncbi:H-NS family nucleoid-associated regulatory protein [Vogesella urethralis]|uniref:H-NS family nucleoid-associated regulatory protein n=1 Tax=Vogesella urethralis TaxID=2592656 RepID=UPI0011849C15|nr:H-NS histone family protein [Vogesella urethralis]